MKNALIFSDQDIVKCQLENFAKYKEYIENLLKKVEDEYNILIFYASESGSRGLGIDVEDSDFDITGFFIPKNELEYFKIIRKYDKFIKITQEKIKVIGEDFDFDLELYDLKYWLNKKVVKNLTSCDFWFESDLIYRNYFPESVAKIRQYINPPFLLYWGKAKSGLTYNQKDISNKGECLNKSLMNVLTSLFQYFHYQIFYTFPKFNILEEIKFLYQHREHILKDGIIEEDLVILDKAVSIYLDLLEQKKKNRKSTSKEIPKGIVDLISLTENRFETKMKKSQLDFTMTEEIAQNIFDELRKLVMNYNISEFI
jgi:hypothetical protein